MTTIYLDDEETSVATTTVHMVITPANCAGDAETVHGVFYEADVAQAYADRIAPAYPSTYVQDVEVWDEAPNLVPHYQAALYKRAGLGLGVVERQDLVSRKFLVSLQEPAAVTVRSTGRIITVSGSDEAAAREAWRRVVEAEWGTRLADRTRGARWLDEHFPGWDKK